MRTLWVSGSASLGGAQLSMAEGVDALSERGHEVHVVLPEEGPLRRRLASAASVHICWHNCWKRKPFPPFWRRLRSTAYNLAVASNELAQIARATGAQVVVSDTFVVWAGAVAARRAGRPHVWFVHEFGWEGSEDAGMRFRCGRRASLAFMKRHADLFLVNSATLRSHFAQWLPEAKLRRVHLAVEVPAGLPNEPPADGPFRLVLVGERTAHKGQQDAVAAVEILAAAGLDVELHLIGSQRKDGFDRQLRDRANLAVDRVHFVDFQENPFKLVIESDVGLMCSPGEAFGRVTIEAMKLGKPVVGARAGATPELVRHGWNGFLYESGNPADLARWIARLYCDRTAAREMGRRGQAWAVETFNRDIFGAELEGALEQVGSHASDIAA